MGTFAVLLLPAISSVLAAGCVPSPVPIRIGNVTLSNHKVARGLDLSIGNPPQSFAFLPQWPLNNTLVYGADGHCVINGTTTPTACTTFRGGAYYAFASTSRKAAGQESSPVDSAPFPQVSRITDTILFNGDTGISNFPLGIPLSSWGEQGYHPMNALGLGTNSTILNTLKSTGRIASKTWSMFWGRDGVSRTSQLDGIMVFGGYDKAKVTGQKVVHPLTPSVAACPSQLVVTITDMVLNFANGTDASIFPASVSTAMQACIVPDYPVLMTLPLNPFFGNFQLLTGVNLTGRSFGLNFFAMRYPAAGGAPPYTGDLTIRLQSGLSVRVPNDQLVVPSRTFDVSSGDIVIDRSDPKLGPDLVINPIQNVNANDMAQLGRQFLSAAVLMVNTDAAEFTLWQANPTADSALVAVDAQGAEVETFCEKGAATPSIPVPTGSGGGDATSLPGQSSSESPLSSGLSPGMVAGIATSVTAVLGSVVAAAIILLRRRRHQVSSSNSASTAQRKDLGERDAHEIEGHPRAELVGSKRGSEFWHRMSSLGKPMGGAKELEGSTRHFYELQG